MEGVRSEERAVAYVPQRRDLGMKPVQPLIVCLLAGVGLLSGGGPSLAGVAVVIT